MNSKTFRREVTELARKYNMNGPDMTGGCHLKFTHRTTGKVVITSLSPSCHYALKNVEGDMRRAGKQ